MDSNHLMSTPVKVNIIYSQPDPQPNPNLVWGSGFIDYSTGLGLRISI